MIRNGTEQEPQGSDQLQLYARNHVNSRLDALPVDLSKLHAMYEAPMYAEHLKGVMGRVVDSISLQYSHEVASAEMQQGPLATQSVFENHIRPRIDNVIYGARFTANETFPDGFRNKFEEARKTKTKDVNGEQAVEKGPLADFSPSELADFLTGKLAVQMAVGWAGSVPFTITEIAEFEGVTSKEVQDRLNAVGAKAIDTRRGEPLEVLTKPLDIEPDRF